MKKTKKLLEKISEPFMTRVYPVNNKFHKFLSSTFTFEDYFNLSLNLGIKEARLKHILYKNNIDKEELQKLLNIIYSSHYIHYYKGPFEFIREFDLIQKSNIKINDLKELEEWYKNEILPKIQEFKESLGSAGEQPNNVGKDETTREFLTDSRPLFPSASM